MKFDELGLCEPVLRAIRDAGYQQATPIQAKSLPHTMANRDVLGCAQTGTGKTAAFALPVLNRIAEDLAHAPKGRSPKCLVLSPTRELAIQIGESFDVYGKHLRKLSVSVIFGGVGQASQVKQLRDGVDVLIATPGRLMDLLQQRHVKLSSVQTFVLDEADRMLDMGFIHDIRKIARAVPRNRQTLLFSATMPKPIRTLAHNLLTNPVTVEAAVVSSTAERIEQSVYHVEKPQKTALLAHLIKTQSIGRGIVFSRTKHGADRIVRQLKKYEIKSEAIHGNKSQNARQRSLNHFRDGKVHLLVATDIASRGIDVDGVSHVFNYDLPNEPESYVHRIGRTARAGASGVAISFCAEDEKPYLKEIEKLIDQTVQVCEPDDDFVPSVTVQSGSKAKTDPWYEASKLRSSAENKGGRGKPPSGGRSRAAKAPVKGQKRGGGVNKKPLISEETEAETPAARKPRRSKKKVDRASYHGKGSGSTTPVSRSKRAKSDKSRQADQGDSTGKKFGGKFDGKSGGKPKKKVGRRGARSGRDNRGGGGGGGGARR